MFHSYIIENKFEKINRLMDQFCNACNIPERNMLNDCEHCNLAHRKNNATEAYKDAKETELVRLNSFTEVMTGIHADHESEQARIAEV